MIQRLFEIYNNSNAAGPALTLDIIKTSVSMQRTHQALVNEASTTAIASNSPPSPSATTEHVTMTTTTTTTGEDLEKLASLATASNELLLTQLSAYRDELDKRPAALSKLASDLFHSSTAHVLMSSNASVQSGRDNTVALRDLDLTEQHFNLDALILVPFKFLIQSNTG
jgi:hypothetical protein